MESVKDSPSRVGAMLSSFWKPTMKAPGSIKSVSSSELKNSGNSQYPISVDAKSSPELLQKRNSQNDINNKNPTPVTSPQFNKRSSATQNRPDTPSTVRFKKFEDILNDAIVDLRVLRKLAWQGIPESFRAMTWKLLLEYLPTNRDRRESTLERKRKEYSDCVQKYFNVDEKDRTNDEQALFFFYKSSEMYHELTLVCYYFNKIMYNNV